MVSIPRPSRVRCRFDQFRAVPAETGTPPDQRFQFSSVIVRPGRSDNAEVDGSSPSSPTGGGNVLVLIEVPPHVGWLVT
jgi:hypothetical protein